MIFLSLFSESQISTYLKKVFPGNPQKISQARELIMSMKSLRMRPMLLAYVEDLMDAERHGGISDWTPFRIHASLVDAWLSREERKRRNIAKAHHPRAGCHVMSIYLQEIGDRTVDAMSLSALLRRARVKQSIQDVEEFGGRSLLNLNSDGNYRFSHYSIQEFLVVDYMSRYPDKMAEISARIRYSDELVAFLVNWTWEAGKKRRASLNGADLSGAILRKANLGRSTLNGASLRDADCRAVDFRESRLYKADLSGANLKDSNLSSAELAGANLRRATLGGANLKRANFEGANLGGANLRESRGLVQKQLAAATGDTKTVVPVGLKRPKSWMPAIRLETNKRGGRTSRRRAKKGR